MSETTTTPRLLKRTEVLELLGISNSWLYALIAEDRFPRPLKFGHRTVRWREEDVKEWIESQPVAS